MSALDPKAMAQNPQLASSKMKRILDILVSKRQYNPMDAEILLQQFNDFIALGLENGCLNEFKREADKQADRLDIFYHERLSTDAKYKKLWGGG